MQLALFDRIHEGPDWLAHPDLQAFLRAEGLDDVTIECLGPRKSFAGKTWPHFRLIHLVSTGVHPIRWLLTLVHELAHVADYRQRVRDFTQEHGRPYVPGRRDGRVVWRMDRVHGRRWRAEFVRLAEAAIAAGLFPGNEERVLQIARTATTSLDDVDLDLRSDRRVVAEELRVLDEERHASIMRCKAERAEFRRAVKRGLVVHFDAGLRQGVLTGQLLRVNRQSCTVAVAGVNWLVPHGQLRQGPAPPDARPAQHRPHPRDRFSVGDGVTFRGDGRRHEGQVIRVNRKTCTVQTPEGTWRVAFSLLKPFREAAPG
ncbi:hypothetical protein LLH23_03535 [bacterium]|nr:hypothetical protein [bacterium]